MPLEPLSVENPTTRPRRATNFNPGQFGHASRLTPRDEKYYNVTSPTLANSDFHTRILVKSPASFACATIQHKDQQIFEDATMYIRRPDSCPNGRDGCRQSFNIADWQTTNLYHVRINKAVEHNWISVPSKWEKNNIFITSRRQICCVAHLRHFFLKNRLLFFDIVIKNNTTRNNKYWPIL